MLHLSTPPKWNAAWGHPDAVCPSSCQTPRPPITCDSVGTAHLQINQRQKHYTFCVENPFVNSFKCKIIPVQPLCVGSATRRGGRAIANTNTIRVRREREWCVWEKRNLLLLLLRLHYNLVTTTKRPAKKMKEKIIKTGNTVHTSSE